MKLWVYLWLSYFCKKSQGLFSFFWRYFPTKMAWSLKDKQERDCKVPHFKPRSHSPNMQTSKYHFPQLSTPWISAPFELFCFVISALKLSTLIITPFSFTHILNTIHINSFTITLHKRHKKHHIKLVSLNS